MLTITSILIEDSLENSDREPSEFHADREDHVELQRSNNGVSDIGEPVSIEVRNGSFKAKGVDDP